VSKHLDPLAVRKFCPYLDFSLCLPAHSSSNGHSEPLVKNLVPSFKKKKASQLQKKQFFVMFAEIIPV
jgi:hypothetical protein